MKDKTVAIALYMTLALIVAGLVIYALTAYLSETETAVNEERVRFQDY